MSTHNVCFHGKIRKLTFFFLVEKKVAYLSIQVICCKTRLVDH